MKTTPSGARPVTWINRKLGAVAWVWVVVLAAILITSATVWFTARQREVSDRYSAELILLRQSRIDLIKGYLYVTLAGSPASPFDRRQGFALLDQAQAELDQARQLQVAIAAEDASQADLAAFKQRMADFRDMLARWPGGSGSTPAQETELRIDLYALEQEAGQVDSRIQLDLAQLSERYNELYTRFLAGVAILFAVICAAVYAGSRARQRAVAALRVSEERFRVIYEHANDAIHLSDASNRIVQVNSRMCELMGYGREELLAMRVADLQAPEIRQGDNVIASELAHYGNALFERLNLHRDGHRIPVEVSVAPIPSLQGQLYVSIVRDITERKRAETALRTSEQRYRSLFENMLNGLAYCRMQFDAEGRPVDFVYLEVNRAFGQLTGLTDVVGKSVGEVIPGIRTTSPELIERYARVAMTGEPLTFETYVPALKMWFSVSAYSPQNGCFVAVFDVITERKRAEKDLKRRVAELEALRVVDRAITASFDLHLTLDVLLEQALSRLKADAAAVLLHQPLLQTLEYEAVSGFRSRRVQGGQSRLGSSLAGRAVLERATIHVTGDAVSRANGGGAPLWAREGFVDYYGVPLMVQGETKGVLEVFGRTPLNADPSWLAFLNTLAGQAAIAIANARLFHGLERANLDLSLAYDATIEGWSRALDLRDRETEGHTQRVTEMALDLAQRLGVNDADLVHIRRGALLHDIGKMGVPDSILIKPDKLTDEEWVVMRRHPQWAFDMLAPIVFLRPALDIPYCHHEKWDGTGYPRQLAGDRIPLAARLFAIVDVWDALTSDRPYRAAWPKDIALAYIAAHSGTHFDPQVVQAFQKHIAAPEDR